MTLTDFRRGFALSAVASLALCAAPGVAHAGFLDQLFGGFNAPQPAPQVNYNAPAAQPDNFGYSPIRPTHRAKKRVVAAVDTTPKLQKTTDLMSDKTLRPGDAIMMKSGVHIYTGAESSHHDADEFVALDEARHVSKQARGELASLDMTRRAPLNYVASADVQEGRSAASGGPVLAQGYRITDARGRSIRYVGP